MRDGSAKVPPKQKVVSVNGFSSDDLTSKLSGNRMLAKMVEERLAKIYARHATQERKLIRQAREIRQKLIEEAIAAPRSLVH